MSGKFSQVIDSQLLLFYRELHGMILLSPSLKPSFSFLLLLWFLFPLPQSQTQQFYKPHVSPGAAAQQCLLAQGRCGVPHAQRCLSLAGNWPGTRHGSRIISLQRSSQHWENTTAWMEVMTNTCHYLWEAHDSTWLIQNVCVFKAPFPLNISVSVLPAFLQAAIPSAPHH